MAEKIIKVVGLFIRDAALLIVRKRGDSRFISLGGKIEVGESDFECLCREVREEIGCSVVSAEFFDSFEGMNLEKTCPIEVRCYFVVLEGNPKPQSEIEECRFVGKSDLFALGSMLELHIIPALVKKGLL